jgi:CelD/BcsL family acetyltransferase involved in cellulose biosynthesis
MRPLRIGTITYRQTVREVNRTLRLVVLTEIPEDPQLRQQWNALVQSVDRPQVFFTYEWALAVQRAYTATLRPLLFLAYDEAESLCGVAAFSSGAGDRHVSFLCCTTADYCDFLSTAKQKSEFVTGVLGELRNRGFRDLTLANLPADSDTVVSLQSASKLHGYHCFSRTAYICAQVALGKLERRPNENKLILPGRKMVRRSLSAMGREAPVRLDHARNWDAVAPILPQFMQAHVARFLVTGRISNMARPERRRFLEELARLLEAPGWFVLTRMMSGQKTLAWNLGFQFEGVWFWYQPTFDSDFEKLSPGFCLLTKLIEEAADDPGFTMVDLGLGAEEYKERFANRSRETLYATLRTSATDNIREIVRYGAAQIVKTSPRLGAAVRAAAMHLRRVKNKVRRDGVISALPRLASRVGGALWSKTEVLFFEWGGAAAIPDSDAAKLQPLRLDHLASAAAGYFDKESALEYLLGSAAHLREKNAEGFGLFDSAGSLLGCVWAASFEGFFLPELNAKLDAPSQDCVMLFDFSSLPADAKNIYGEQTLTLTAEYLRAQGKKAWSYSAASDDQWVRRLKDAGFQPRYSLMRRRVFGWQTIQGKTPKQANVIASEVSARV